MAYMPHIENLYRAEGQKILLFKECFALEKIHGTSTKLVFRHNLCNNNWDIKYHAGGESYNNFVGLFNQEKLIADFVDVGISIDKEVEIFMEAYGGKQQGMSDTYGKELKVIIYDIKVGDDWLSVIDAENVTKKLGLEFVHYNRVSTDLKYLDAERDAFSVQAVRNAEKYLMECKISLQEFETFKTKKREGVVLRPIIEVKLNNGERVIAKHKGDDFKETATSRTVVDPSKMKVLEDANLISNEWVTLNRLEHVLDKIPNHSIEKMRDIISLMVEDVLREAKGEIIESEMVKKSISKKTVEIYKLYLKSKIIL